MRPPTKPTAEDIESARSENGGWTREQLTEWGVAWPPPKGWKRALTDPDERGLSDRAPRL